MGEKRAGYQLKGERGGEGKVSSDWHAPQPWLRWGRHAVGWLGKGEDRAGRHNAV